MKNLLLVGLIAASAFVIYEGLFGDAASTRLLGGYVAASAVAFALTKVVPPWTAKIKWAWVALCLVVIYSIVSGPLAYLQIN